jgi:hypothetical protein
MVDPLFLVFWPGAIAIGGFVALPVAMGLQALNRRLGRSRNRSWHCGQCNAALARDDVAGNVFRAHGVYICNSCADILRRRYRVALVAVPVVAAIAGVTTLLGIFAGPQPLAWYFGFRLIPVFLPSVGVGAAFWWRIRAAKAANARELQPALPTSIADRAADSGVIAPGA